MKKLYILLGILIFLAGCGNKMALKTFSEVEGKSDFKNKEKPSAMPSPASAKSYKSIASKFIWQDIKILYNEYSKKIIFENPDMGSIKKISLLKNEAILVEDILNQLNFSSKIEFFNYLRNFKQEGYTFHIYIDDKYNYKYIYGITLMNKGKK